MKIKTITCHEVYNYGASLQEYALLKYVESLGHTAVAIHYKPSYLSNHFNLRAVSSKYNFFPVKYIYLLAKLPGRLKALKRKKAFDRFSLKYIKTEKKIYKSNAALKANPPEADAYICGSDQIWNSFFQNGKDPAFYLDFVPDTKLKISYAASFATDKLNVNIKPFVKEKVNRLNHVSVRETSGVRILNDLGIKDVIQVLDPVFLLEKVHWDTFLFPVKEDYIFVYDFDSNPLIKEIALELKRKKGWKIYSLNQNIDYADKNFWLEGPERFLSLVSQSKMNLTNSFHSVAFSLIFEKQFLVVNRAEQINTRMRDLLSVLNLENLLINEKMDFKTDLINYSIVNEKIERLKEKSILFLKQALLNKTK